jgi:hypothetical protein
MTMDGHEGESASQIDSAIERAHEAAKLRSGDSLDTSRRRPKWGLQNWLMLASVVAVLPLVVLTRFPLDDLVGKEFILAYAGFVLALIVWLFVVAIRTARRKQEAVRRRESTSASAPGYIRINEYLAAHPKADRDSLERIARSEQAKEDTMIERVRRLPLLDGVFTYEHHRRHVGRGAHPGVRHHELTDILPGADPTQVGDATRRARALLADTYRYGDEWHSQRARAARDASLADEPDTAAEMRREHPGFTDESYSVAMSRGAFEAMW